MSRAVYLEATFISGRGTSGSANSIFLPMISEASITSMPMSFPSALKSAWTPGTTVTVWGLRGDVVEFFHLCLTFSVTEIAQRSKQKQYSHYVIGLLSH